MSAPLHKRFGIDAASIYGVILRKSGWTGSALLKWPLQYGRLTVVGVRHQQKIWKTLGTLIGEPVVTGTCFGEMSESKVYPLLPADWIDWLHANCTADWLIAEHRQDGGIKVWFEDSTDAMTFDLTWPQLRK